MANTFDDSFCLTKLCILPTLNKCQLRSYIHYKCSQTNCLAKILSPYVWTQNLSRLSVFHMKNWLNGMHLQWLLCYFTIIHYCIFMSNINNINSRYKVHVWCNGGSLLRLQISVVMLGISISSNSTSFRLQRSFVRYKDCMCELRIRTYVHTMTLQRLLYAMHVR